MMKVVINIVESELQNLINLVEKYQIDLLKVEPNDKGNLTITLIVDDLISLVNLYEFVNG